MLKNDIGINAGAIWMILSEKGKLSINELIEYTNYKEYYILLSLGWLARENKIHFSEENGVLYIELNLHTSDMYY